MTGLINDILMISSLEAKDAEVMIFRCAHQRLSAGDHGQPESRRQPPARCFSMWTASLSASGPMCSR